MRPHHLGTHRRLAEKVTPEPPHDCGRDAFCFAHHQFCRRRHLVGCAYFRDRQRSPVSVDFSTEVDNSGDPGAADCHIDEAVPPRPPERVRHELCERVTNALGDIREHYGLEVSSPGPRRPLTKPEHYRRFIGRRARVSTLPSADLGERRRVTGELVGATSQEVTLAAEEGIVAIPYAAIKRSHLMEE